MANTTYRGDSPGKKVVRARTWLYAAHIMQRVFNAPLKRALVLAGHGGDISTLKGWKIPDDKIVAVDYCPDAAEFCDELYPDVEVHHGTVEAVSSNVEFNVAHLDFCGGMTVNNIAALVEVIRNMDLRTAGYQSKKVGFVAVTLMRGREPKKQSASKIMVNSPRSERRRVLREIRKGRLPAVVEPLYRGGDFVLQDALNWGEADLRRLCTKRLPFTSDAPKPGMTFYDPFGWFGPRSRKLTPIGAIMVRNNVLRYLVNALLEPYNLSAFPSMQLAYQSSTKDSHGTPFMTTGFVVCPEDEMENVYNDLMELEHMDMERNVHLLNCENEHDVSKAKGSWAEVDALDGRPSTIVANPCTGLLIDGYKYQDEFMKKRPRAQGTVLLDFMDSADSISTLKAFALSVVPLIGVKSTSELLDIPKGRLAAWKAHQTMGTYDNVLATRTQAGHPRTLSRVSDAQKEYMTLNNGWGLLNARVERSHWLQWFAKLNAEIELAETTEKLFQMAKKA